MVYRHLESKIFVIGRLDCRGTKEESGERVRSFLLWARGNGDLDLGGNNQCGRWARIRFIVSCILEEK